MRVLFIGTVRPSQQRIVDLGHDIVLFMKRKDFAITKSIANRDLSFKYQSINLFSDDATIAEYIDQAKAIHTHRPIEGVCCYNDGMQEIAIEISDALGLPYSIDKETLKTVCNKHLTRQAVENLGLDHTKYYLVNDENELREKIECIDYPAIMKPFAATGSSGISKIESPAEIKTAIDWYKECGNQFPAIIEEFLHGEEFSVEALSEDGEHFILAITKKFIDPDSFVELGHMVPAPLNKEQQENINDFTKAVLSAVGINNGASHTEVMLTSKGPRLIETHTRPGGDGIFELVQQANGIDLLTVTAQQSIGAKVIDELKSVQPTGKTAVIYFLSPAFEKNVCLESIEGLQEALEVEGVFSVKLLKEAGDLLGAITNSSDRAAQAIAIDSDPEKAIEIAKIALSKLKFTTTWQQQAK